MPETELLMAITLFICVLIGFVALVRAFNLRSLHKTVALAIENGSPDTSALIDRLGRGPRLNNRLIAYVLIALAAAIVGAGLLQGDLADIRDACSAALFPGLVGTAVLLYARGADRAGGA